MHFVLIIECTGYHSPFSTVPREYWHNIIHQRTFFDWLGLELGFKQVNCANTHVHDRPLLIHIVGRLVFCVSSTN